MGKKEEVSRILQANTEGLTVTEIAAMLSISRNTVSVALAELKGEGLIRVRPIGMAKLHYWNETAGKSVGRENSGEEDYESR